MFGEADSKFKNDCLKQFMQKKVEHKNDKFKEYCIDFPENFKEVVDEEDYLLRPDGVFQGVYSEDELKES